MYEAETYVMCYCNAAGDQSCEKGQQQ